jgi:plastocyanin
MTVDAERLKSVLGIADVTFIPGRSALAVIDATLSGEPPAFEAATHDAMMRRQTTRRTTPLAPNQIGIDNFQFSPRTLTIKAGTTITWINNDDVPHLIVNVQRAFKQSPVLDTDQRFSATLTKPGTYNYFCSLHPQMQGTIVVK